MSRAKDRAAAASETGCPREGRFWAHANGADDEIRGHEAAIRQVETFRARVAADPRRIRFEQHAHAARLHRVAQERRGARIELTLHQAVHQMHERHIGAEAREAERRLEAEKTAADDRDRRAGMGGVREAARIVEIAECDDAWQVHAGLGQADRLRARRENELVVGQCLAICELDA